MNLPSGASELLRLGKGISESKETNYLEEEQRLFKTKQDIKKLLEGMEQQNNAKTQ